MGYYKDLIKSSKKNKIHFLINYILTPIWFFIFFVCLTIVLIFMTSESKDDFILPSAILAGVIALLILAALIGMPLLKKKEIQAEIARYDFDAFDSVNDTGAFYFNYNLIDLSNNTQTNALLIDDGSKIEFNRSGVCFEDRKIPYDDLVFFITTSNKIGVVRIAVEFNVDGKQNVEIELNKELAYILLNYNVQLDSKPDLEYLINNKADAIKQIYNTGIIVEDIGEVEGKIDG